MPTPCKTLLKRCNSRARAAVKKLRALQAAVGISGVSGLNLGGYSLGHVGVSSDVQLLIEQLSDDQKAKLASLKDTYEAEASALRDQLKQLIETYNTNKSFGIFSKSELLDMHKKYRELRQELLKVTQKHDGVQRISKQVELLKKKAEMGLTSTGSLGDLLNTTNQLKDHMDMGNLSKKIEQLQESVRLLGVHGPLSH